jgi:hypothetical protein
LCASADGVRHPTIGLAFLEVATRTTVQQVSLAKNAPAGFDLIVDVGDACEPQLLPLF